MTQRIDVHLPSVINMIDYEFLETYTFKMVSEGDGFYFPLDVVGAAFFTDLRENESVNFADTHGAGKDETCDICGARFVYGVLFKHLPTSDIIKTGQDCASTVCEGIAAKLTVFERRTAAAAKKARRGAKAKRIRRERWARLRIFLTSIKAEFPDLNAILRNDHRISRDLRINLIQWGKMSPKQIELAYKLVVQKEEANEIEIPVSDKRVKIVGTILGTKEKEDPYSYCDGTITMMLVSVPHGDGAYKLWGKIPQGIWDGTYDINDERRVAYDAAISEIFDGVVDKEDPEEQRVQMNELHGRADAIPDWKPVELKGLDIEFVCRINISDKDKTFGFISRPTKAKIITTMEG